MPSISRASLGYGVFAAGDQVGVDFVEAVDHLGVDAQHGAADAGVFVFARGGVWASALAEFDFAFVEVLLELGPFVVGDGAVFDGWAAGAPVG
jgi:hypothetical protein